MPPYSIIKDLFDYFDKRRDGNIDQTEWMDVFAQFEYIPQASVLKNTFGKPRPQTSIANKNAGDNSNSLKNLKLDSNNNNINGIGNDNMLMDNLSK